MYHDSHVLSCHVMVLRVLHIPEVGVGSPEQFGGVGSHRERLAEVVRESGVVPPLAEENVH